MRASGPRATRKALLLAALVPVLAGCGARPPQAPFTYAKQLDSATSGISTACGLAYQATAFPGNHRADLTALDATAAMSAQKLADVYHRNRNWIYQDETVRQIVGASASMLASCGLNRARHALLRTAGEQ
jgi:hypothetical protein